LVRLRELHKGHDDDYCEENSEQNNVDVEEESIPSQESQEAVHLDGLPEREEVKYLMIILCSFKKINSTLA
jgi:hypothetical protein